MNLLNACSIVFNVRVYLNPLGLFPCNDCASAGGVLPKRVLTVTLCFLLSRFARTLSQKKRTYKEYSMLVRQRLDQMERNGSLLMIVCLMS